MATNFIDINRNVPNIHIHKHCRHIKEKEMIIEKLIKAINKVPNHYYETKNPKAKNGQIRDYAKKIVFPERNFCTNLYHHFSNEIEKKGSDLDKLDIGEKFFLDEEIYKKCSGTYLYDREQFDKTLKELNIAKKGMRPDLVLHASQQENNNERQLLILECKIDPNLKRKEFYADYFKLNIYKSELNFQNSVYLILNNIKNKICKYLSDYKEKYWETPKGAIQILIKENSESEVSYIVSDNC
jgi:hypothetical protein